MNGYLQSTNEELRTMNEELQRRGEELNQVNAFLESILSSLRAGVVVADRNLVITIWNGKCEDLWGLRGDEARGKNLLNLDIGLPVERLRQPIRACLSNESEYSVTVLDAVNRRGRGFQCKVICTPLLGIDKLIKGIILLMEDIQGKSA